LRLTQLPISLKKIQEDASYKNSEKSSFAVDFYRCGSDRFVIFHGETEACEFVPYLGLQKKCKRYNLNNNCTVNWKLEPNVYNASERGNKKMNNRSVMSISNLKQRQEDDNYQTHNLESNYRKSNYKRN
jgi:hypothetical protein